jgi:OPT family oligopeptide transporter
MTVNRMSVTALDLECLPSSLTSTFISLFALEYQSVDASPVNPPTQKSVPLSRVSMTHSCPSIHSACMFNDISTLSRTLTLLNRWFLGVFYTILISALNQFFSFRCKSHKPVSQHRCLIRSSDPSVYLTGIVVQLTTLPLGKGLGAVLPTTRYNTFGYTWSLNPGPFSIKEHVVITVMGNVVVWGAYTTDVVASQRVFYGHTVTFSYQMLLALSTQLMGFGLAGILRQFLVWPSAMIWPGALVNAALFNTLHKNYNKQESKHISRHRFFYITVGLSFLWYWIPGFLWTGLSVFNWVCWIAPNNVAVNQLFGTLSGLGMGILTFDWSMISYIGSPLVTPVRVCCSLRTIDELTRFYSGGPKRTPLWPFWLCSGS